MCFYSLPVKFKRYFILLILCAICSMLCSCNNRYADVLDGIWYEQKTDGGILEIKGNNITYTIAGKNYSSSFKAEEQNGAILLYADEELYYFYDITCYPDDYSILCHTRPDSEGGQGYQALSFRRGVYIEPEPSAGDVIDLTDENADKLIEDYSFSSLNVQYYVIPEESGDETDPQDGTDSEEHLTASGAYSYSISVFEDGSGVLQSDHYPDIALSADKIAQIADLLKECELAALNGYDIRIYQLEEGQADYTIDMEMDSGAHFHSSANGKYVLKRWSDFQQKLDELLFSFVVNGGYDPESGAFHPTTPMKRIGLPNSSMNLFSFSIDEKRIEREGIAYDYTNYVDYVVFSGGDDAHKNLRETLYSLNSTFEQISNAELSNQTELMENVPSSQRTGDDITVYSFYSIDTLHSDQLLFWFRISEGHGNSLGIGEYGTSTYIYERFAFDSETGKRVNVSELFIDTEYLEDEIIYRLVSSFIGDSHENYLKSTEFRDALHNMLYEPEIYGYIEWEPSFQGLTIYLPQSLTPDFDYRLDIMFYYEDYQNMLSDRYTSVW